MKKWSANSSRSLARLRQSLIKRKLGSFEVSLINRNSHNLMARRFAKRALYLAALTGFRVGCLAGRILPRNWLFGFADASADLGFLLFRGYRTASMTNLHMALAGSLAGDARTIAQRSLRNFFRACLEIVIAMVSSEAEQRAAVPLVGREHLDAALAKGNGVIILSAHLGNFFLVGTRLGLEGHAVHVLINQPPMATLPNSSIRPAEDKAAHDPRATKISSFARAQRGFKKQRHRDNHRRRISQGKWRTHDLVWPHRAGATWTGDSRRQNRRRYCTGLHNPPTQQYSETIIQPSWINYDPADASRKYRECVAHNSVARENRMHLSGSMELDEFSLVGRQPARRRRTAYSRVKPQAEI